MSIINKNGWSIIAISGVTCGGKTTVAKRLQKELPNCVAINQDEYFYLDNDPRHVKVPGLDHNNYDILSSLDMGKMYTDIIEIISKNDSYLTNSTDITEKDLSSYCVVIVEGFTVLNYKPIEEICDMKYQIFLDREECKKRRDNRVYDPPDISGYFEKCIWPEYCKYSEELKSVGHVSYLDGTKNDLFDSVFRDIKICLKF